MNEIGWEYYVKKDLRGASYWGFLKARNVPIGILAGWEPCSFWEFYKFRLLRLFGGLG